MFVKFCELNILVYLYIIRTARSSSLTKQKIVIMKTSNFNTNQYLIDSTNRVNDYVNKLKHGKTFKYVKGFNSTHKLLMSICLDRQNKGSFLRISNKELEAFDMNPSNKNGLFLAVDVNIDGKLNIVPVNEF